MIPGFEDSVNKLVLLSKKFVTYTVTTGEYPPCIKHAIDILEKGENPRNIEIDFQNEMINWKIVRLLSKNN